MQSHDKGREKRAHSRVENISREKMINFCRKGKEGLGGEK